METVKGDDGAIGNHTKVKVVKNKVAPPFKEAEFDIIYGQGISKSGNIVDVGVDFGVIQKAGSWFSYEGEKIGQGREAVKKMLESDEALCFEIEQKIREKAGLPLIDENAENVQSAATAFTPVPKPTSKKK